MPRGTLMPATIALIIAVGIGPRAQAQELSCPPGYALNSSNTGCVPSQPSPGSAQGGVAGQAQRLFNSFGAAVQGASSKATGALGGMLNSFGLQGSGAAPNEAAPSAGNAGTAPSGFSTAPTNVYGSEHPSKTATAAHGACSLLSTDDVAAVLGGPVKLQESDSGIATYNTTDATACSYQTADNASSVELMVSSGGRADFDQYNRGMPCTPLSGVGDKACLNNLEPGASGQAEVSVLKGGTYFTISTNLTAPQGVAARSAVALARKVAERM